ncbi:helix-hairpin-helix domain-containing protein, partial [Proteus terrae]|uniref:helix-hairpin-helix domain-containing protein n=1 Tax=Proteus terrae TaxID=1574161 RepID=UPI003314857C
LARKLDTVVEDCVNGVGVDLNTASVPLLTRVAGLSQSIAQNILQSTHQKIDDLMGNSALISQVDARAFITEQFGLPTINDI